MTPTLFLVWRERVAEAPALSGLAGLTRALAFTPEPFDPASRFARDGRGPALTWELAFADEAAFASGVAALKTDGCEAQAMRARDFPTPDPRLSSRPCTLLVEYKGACADLAGWLDHYDAHHPAIMARFPGVREVATYRPAADLPLPAGALRREAMQRNKVVFDSVAALNAALASPVMIDMRADFEAFPPYEGAATHHPNATADLLA